MIRRSTISFVLAVTLAAAPAAAAADGAPSAERLRALSATLDSATFVRVHARRGTFEARRAFADSAGVRVTKASGRSGLIVVGGADTLAGEQRLLRWSEVERIEAGRGRSSAPAVLGLLIGAAAIGAAKASGAPNEGTAPLYYGAGILAGVSVLVGLVSMGSPPVHTVFP